ncbi:MAG: YopX family protein [Candidatus Hodarchaeales archaeon]
MDQLKTKKKKTGRKDIFGKEIYEGDIVRTFIEIKEDTISSTPIDLMEVIGVVVYDSGSFYVDVKFKYSSKRIKLTSPCEVIGNIYENEKAKEFLRRLINER